MMIPTKSAMADWARMREIVTILAKYGLGEFIIRIKLSARPWQNQENKAQAVRHRYLTTPQRVRMAFEELGPTFIKLGQILSTRVDVFGQEWTEELSQLQSNVRPIDNADIHALIQAQLIQPTDSVFAGIDPKPIGSASIAQVHRATLCSGEEVAVKIKRPGIDERMAGDLRILNHMARLIEAEIPESRRYHPVQMMQFFARSLSKETDLSVELRSMQRFRRLYAQRDFLHIPKAYPAYSNRQLLIQEYIDDTLLKNIDLAALDSETKNQLATRITDTLFGMILQQGFFHADPHPGNIFVGRDGRITLIDFGLVGQLTPSRRHEIISLINALVEHDQFTMQFVLSNWAQGDLPDEDLLGAEVMEMMMNYENISMKDLHISQVINDITQITRTHGLTLPSDLVMLFKCLITLDGVVKQLDGDFELLSHIKPIVEKMVQARFSPDQVWRHSKIQTHLLARVADELPQNLLRVSRRMQKGQVGVNLHFKHMDELNNQLDRVTNRLTMGIVTAALIIGSSIVLSINAGPKFMGLSFFGFMGYLLAFANSLWVLWSIWRSGKH